ncbi:choice-of-anchor L domain-containing protein [Chryseobacterium sp.]|uniref:choice-of-anchor L domain-containing protein n=1 Tax=Chryseobacterium sp. TaxID=1871047 RepID=UPI0011CB6D3F|nr:choice-of-anchor L domain-containing protein [Chryseobacterium sp.]TXF77714.1 T9SS type B sorting domain-containing protein [Chryseobacterium sp.]
MMFLFAAALSGQSRPPAAKIIPPNAKAGDYIDVNVPTYPESAFTPTQLVTDVLVGSSPQCGTPNISNVSITPNQVASNNNRFWGYFNKSTSQFPFAEGIILSTGYARRGGNAAESGVLGDQTGTNSDPDLVQAINTTATLNDAVVLEFDFVPSSTQMKFKYIFASEEYTGGFPCLGYDDAFALLLKPVGGTYTNLAVLPAGAGPVTATNIVPASFTCGPINAQYFGSIAPNQTNYYGRTIPLVAEATVVPGQTYHIKMVLADARDNGYDSAVFLEAGSFDIGVQILSPAGVALPPSINMCDNTPQSLTASVQTPGATYQWFNGTAAIPGATAATYVATQPGVYTVEVTVPGNQCPGSASVTIIGGTSPTVQNATLTACYAPGNATFNLTNAQPAITSTNGVSFSYYVNQADAIAGNSNTIATPTAFSSAGNQIIYVVVKSGFCSKIAQLQLVKAAQMTATIAPPTPITCTNPQIVLNAQSSVYPAGSTFLWTASAGGYVVSGGNTLTPTVNSAGTYTLTIVKTYQPGNIACTVTAAVNVTTDLVKPNTSVTAPKMTICNGESVMLIAAGGPNYIWQNIAGTGNTQTVSPTVTTTYTVTAVGANGCADDTPATITINVIPAITSTLTGGQICPGDEIILDAGTGTNYTYLWSTGDTTQTIVADTPGTYTVTINNGVCTKSFSTNVVQAIVPEVINVIFENNTLTLTASNPSSGVLEYSIDGGVTWQSSNVFTNVMNNVNIVIKVKVKNTSCVGSLEYFTFNMTNVITPNGDGINDEIDVSGVSRYKNFGGNIFDRYGKIIQKLDKTKTNWDGRFQGRSLPTATYWYQLNWEDPANKSTVVKTGWIMLKNRE